MWAWGQAAEPARRLRWRAGSPGLLNSRRWPRSKWCPLGARKDRRRNPKSRARCRQTDPLRLGKVPSANDRIPRPLRDSRPKPEARWLRSGGILGTHQVGGGRRADCTSARYRPWKVLRQGMRNSLRLSLLRDSVFARGTQIGLQPPVVLDRGDI